MSRRNLADFADQDVMLAIAKGSFSGTSYINKFGRNPDIGTGTTPEDICDRGGLWVPPTAARIHGLESGDASDVGSTVSSGSATGGGSTTLSDTGADFVTAGVAAGDIVLNDTNYDHSTVTTLTATTLTLETTYHTGDPSHSGVGQSGFNDGDSYRVVTTISSGAAVIHIFGLDGNLNPQQEFIVTNGTTVVPTVNEYYRIYRMHVDGAKNRSYTNIGVITATSNVNSTVTAQINSGNGQTLMAIYTIPAGKTAYMTNFYAGINRLVGVTTASANIIIVEQPIATVNGVGTRTKHFFSVAQNGTSNYSHSFMPYKKFLANTDIIMRVISVSDNNTDISGGFDLVLIDN